ncbi:MAG: FtsB family cell division protein [Rhodothermales bacterium]
MAASKQQATAFRRLRISLTTAFGLGLFVWVAFFDSHSLARRIAWHQELAQLNEENASLREQIRALEDGLEATPSASVVEQIAREQYGMRRPGETVYRVEVVEGKEEREKGGKEE